jgi:hypothetical protein
LRAADAVKLAYNVDQGDSLFISPLCAVVNIRHDILNEYEGLVGKKECSFLVFRRPKGNNGAIPQINLQSLQRDLSFKDLGLAFFSGIFSSVFWHFSTAFLGQNVDIFRYFPLFMA